MDLQNYFLKSQVSLSQSFTQLSIENSLIQVEWGEKYKVRECYPNLIYNTIVSPLSNNLSF